MEVRVLSSASRVATGRWTERLRARARRAWRLGGRAGWALLALALVLRVGYVVATPHYAPRLDAADYLATAGSIARSGAYPTPKAWVRQAPCPRVPGFPQARCVASRGEPGARLVARPTAYRPPAYPYALGAVVRVARWLHLGPVVAGRVVQALLGTIAAGLVGLLAALVAGRRVGLIALGLAAIDAPLVLVSGTLLSETLFVALELAALCAVLVHRRAGGGRRWLVLAGVLAGLAALTRTNGLVLIVPVALLAWSRAEPDRRRRAVGVLVVGACALATVAPWTVRNAVVLGRFVPVSTETGGTLVGTYNPTSRANADTPATWIVMSENPSYRLLHQQQAAIPETVVDANLRRDAARFVADHPGYLATVLGWNTIRLLDLTGSDRVRFGASTIDVSGSVAAVGARVFHVVLLLALAGALLPAARRVPGAVWLAPLLLYLSIVVVTSETPRFRAGLEPFVLLLAAIAIAAATVRVGDRTRRPRATGAAGPAARALPSSGRGVRAAVGDARRGL